MSSKPEMIFESGFDGYKISWAMGWGMLTMTLTVTIRMRRTNGIYTVQPDNSRNLCLVPSATQLTPNFGSL